MSESMSALDKELLGETTPVVKGCPEETLKAEENVTRKSEDQVDDTDDNKHSVFGPDTSTLTTTDMMELDEKIKHEAKDEVKPSPNKRGADAVNEDSVSPKKKRAPAKPKNAKKADTDATGGAEPVTPKKVTAAKVKKAATTATEGEATTNGTTIVVEPVTPKKRTPAKPKNNTPKAAADNTEAAGEEDSASTAKVKTSPTKAKTANGNSTPRKRAPASGIAPSRGIPDCYENATNADKRLIKMKEDGESWEAIRAAWKEETGDDPGKSTLPNRYNRIKVNMMRLKDGEDVILLAAKETVERKFEHEKWAQIATEMQAQGTDDYPVLFLQKQYKDLTTARPANGSNDTIAATATEGADEDEAMAEE